MIKKITQLARILSLDVVLGAIVGSLFIADYLQVQLPWFFVLALAICVWLIYTADHLSDALKIPHIAHTARHRFHQKFFKPIATVFCLISVSGLVLISQLPFSIILWGSVVLGMVGLYFISIRWLRLQEIIHKEFVIAFLYSVGIFLAPVYLKYSSLGITVWVLFIEYILIALCNLLLFSWYEKDLDEQDQHVSYATAAGNKTAFRTLIGCIASLYAMVVLSTSFLYSSINFLSTQLIILLMVVTLHGILQFPSHFRQYERYRSVADAVFFYPIILLLL
ncbi:hypothetical protein [Catalinimonas niigatensis]|uniref:hypothetical protein n=1 Tax=Catalinimonas niigatensis TaxID=1397264 RepID=UPI002664F70C|nr:hypothetical protein [Catalinimonas niigatensis]WPP52850.1 hypothetical protein PZB72_10730 [Catalinimonas niigatensis]